MCKTAKASQENYKHSTSPTENENAVPSSTLEVSQLIKEIFGKRSHIELIRRSTEILKFILSSGKITKEDFNIIWECCAHDEQSKVEIFKVISYSINLLNTELLGFIIEKFLSLPRMAFKDQDVEIICELSKEDNLNEPLIKQMLALMWRLLKGESSVSHEMLEKVMNKFCILITTSGKTPKEVMDDFFDRWYAMIEENNNSIFALKILRKTMTKLSPSEMEISKAETLFAMLSSRRVFASFFENIEKYFKEAEEKKESLDIQRHKEEVNERKEFLLFIVRCANYKLTKKDLEVLWIAMVKRAITADDQAAFYLILKQLSFHKKEDYLYSMADLIEFFSVVVCAEDNNFQQLQIEGIQMIEKLLIFTNKESENITELETVRKKRYDNFSSYYEDQIQFHVKVLPTQIIGEPMLWKIALEAKSEPVATRAIELISTIYTKLSKELESSIEDISSDFAKVAMEKLRLCFQQMIKNELSRSSEIIKLLRLIEEMLYNSERKGNDGITPLGYLIKGRTFTLKVNSKITNVVNAPHVPKKFELIVHSSLTLWQLRMIISKKLRVATHLLKLMMNNKDLKERDNGKSLEALGIDGTDTIQVKKRDVKFVPKIDLTKNKRFTEEAKKVFEDIFEKFSENGRMSRENCAEYTKACLGDDNIRIDSYQIEGIFKDHDKENKNYLALEDFLDFYENASNTREATVWKNLSELGYGSDLKTLDSQTNDADDNLVKTIKLPRYLLSNSAEYLSLLFSLVGKSLC